MIGLPLARRVDLGATAAILLAACGNANERRAEASATTATPSGYADASASAPASDAQAASASAAPSGDEDGIPRPPNGILSAAEADRLCEPSRAPCIVLLDAGREPRAALRYAVARSAKERSVLTVDVTASQSLPGAPAAVAEFPAIVLDLELEKTAGKGDERRVHGTIAKASVAEPKTPEQGAYAENQKANNRLLVGHHFDCWWTPRGTFHDRSFDVAADAPAQERSLFAGVDQWLYPMWTPLPVEPVGEGARWRVVNRPNTGGSLPAVEFVTYTLESRAGDHLTLTSKTVGLGAEQGTPATDVAEMKAYDLHGDGSAEIDLAAIAPVESRTSFELAMTLRAHGQDAVVTTKMSLAFRRPGATER